MARVYERLGSRELESVVLENTPQYDLYEDVTQNEQIFPLLEPTPEVGDHYIGAEILLPSRAKVARGHLVAWIHSARGNIMGRAHMNPILDTRMYKVEIAGGKVTELTTNIIAKSV